MSPRPRRRSSHPRRPPVTAGLDFTGPVVDLIDEVLDRLSDRWQEDHPGRSMPEHVFERLSEQADAMVMRRLR